MRRHMLSFLVLLGMAAATAAQAAPTLSVQVYEDGVLQTGLSSSSGTGTLILSGSTPNFLVNAFVSGIPTVAAPSLVGQTTAISTATGFTGSHTIRLLLTQTDVPSASAGGLFASLANTLTANLLVSGYLITGTTLENYADNSNTAFGMATLLASQGFTDPGGATPAIVSNLALTGALFSETMVITATFNGGGAALNTSSQIIAVPEPASLALFGTALLGFGLVQRSRRRR